MDPRTTRRITCLVGALALLAACGSPAEQPDVADGATDVVLAADVALDADDAPDEAAPVDADDDAVDAADAAVGDVQCPTGHVACGGACAYLPNDPLNCGACGVACPTGAMCLRGLCSLNATCTPVVYPNVTIQAIPVASMSTAYHAIASGTCYPIPECFLDLNNLQDPSNGRSLDLHVMISDHFELDELVATELAGGYTHYALVDPGLVRHLEALRTQEGGSSISLASGYRSPQHQAATCRSICPGGASCCPSAAHPCGCRSEHEWGRAADLSIAASQYTAYGNDAHAVHFPDCLLEAGSFHVDVSPCPLGCPYNF